MWLNEISVFGLRYALAACVICCLSHSAAFGQTIGRAAFIRNDVTHVEGSSAGTIIIGDDIVRNEVVRTGAESQAKLVFSDDTNLVIGPTSVVTLDSFVFVGDGAYKKAVVTLLKGGLRFITGNSDKRAYSITTSVATIGVRGAVLDILSEPTQTVVLLVEGKAIVCVRDTQRCETVSSPGEAVVVTASEVKRLAPRGPNEPPPVNFNGFCGRIPNLCDATRYAQLPPSTPFNAGDRGQKKN